LLFQFLSSDANNTAEVGFGEVGSEEAGSGEVGFSEVGTAEEITENCRFHAVQA